MFFRRQQQVEPGFAGRLKKAGESGFELQVQPSGLTRVVRNGCAAELRNKDNQPEFVTTGIILGKDLARLTDLGYQKVFETPAGIRQPARAAQLKAIHAFTEDLVEAMGLTSLYNQSLGTVNQAHLYDRVEGREQVHVPRPWER
jgi:hypothetical protein